MAFCAHLQLRRLSSLRRNQFRLNANSEVHISYFLVKNAVKKRNSDLLKLVIVFLIYALSEGGGVKDDPNI